MSAAARSQSRLAVRLTHGVDAAVGHQHHAIGDGIAVLDHASAARARGQAGVRSPSMAQPSMLVARRRHGWARRCRCAPPPGAAVKHSSLIGIVDHAGSGAGRPRTMAAQMVKCGRPFRKAMVPSIGSTTKTRVGDQPRRIVGAFFRQPAIIGPRRASVASCRIFVDGQIGFGDGAAALLVPALVVAAEIFARDLARLAHAAFEKRQVGSSGSGNRSCLRCAASARWCRGGIPGRWRASSCANMSLRLPAMVTSETGNAISPFSIQKPAAPRL